MTVDSLQNLLPLVIYRIFGNPYLLGKRSRICLQGVYCQIGMDILGIYRR